MNLRGARLAAIGLALVAAGCTSVAPSPAPSRGPTPGPPSPPVPSASPTSCADSYAGAPLDGASLERIQPSQATIFLAITWIEPRPAGSDWAVEAVPTVVSPLDPDDITTFVGGVGELELAYDAEPGWSPTVTRAWIGVGPDPAHLAETVTRVSGSVIETDLPDVDGLQVLEAVIDVTDGCLALEARALRQIRIAPAGVAAACPRTIEGLEGLVSEATDLTASPGGRHLRFVASEGEARFSGAFWSADGPILSAWDPRAPAMVVSAGSRLTLRPPSEDLRLRGVSAAFYGRSDMAAGAGGLEIGPVTQSGPAQAADGSVTIPSPTKAGRYVLLLQASFTLPCLVGNGFVVTSVDVP